MTQESTENLLSEIEELRARLAEAEELINAIKAGEVDAFALNKNNKSEVFTLESGDYAYRILVENFSEGALNLTEDGLIVYTNSYFHELLKLPYEKVISNSIFDFINSASKETFNELFRKGLAGQSKGEINLSAGEKLIPVYVSLTSLYPTLPTVGMIITDLTEKKKQEKLLEEQNRELVHNKNFISNVLESTNHGVLSYIAIRENNVVVDFEIRYANEAALEQLNLPAEKVIGSTYLTAIPQAKKYGLWERVTRVLETGKSETHEVTSPELPGRWFMVTYTPFDDGVTCTFIEITEQKKHAKTLEEKNMELAKMNKELQSFAYISSHDLQEPLRKIQTFATRIMEKDNQNLSDSGKDHFKRMQEAAHKMQTLIDDLLTYSRINTVSSKFEKTNLNEIIAEVKEDLKEDIKQKHAIVEVTGFCEATIIPFQFRQLMHNIIGNSLKFSNAGKPPHIKIKCEILQSGQGHNTKLSADKKYCHIQISDNGIGFEPQYNEKIFEVFQRLHGKTEYAGTGIGLSIVKKIVENHDGIITAKSELNKGAAFDIYIPAI